jgi:hypothetical protein
MPHRSIYLLLVASGATPFVACAALMLMGFDDVIVFGRLDQLAALYGLAILCFLTGVHWATCLYDRAAGLPNLFIVSNAVFLGVLLPYVLGHLAISLAAQLLAFPLLLVVDEKLRRARVISDHYFAVRSFATATAWVSLAIILILTL